MRKLALVVAVSLAWFPVLADPIPSGVQILMGREEALNDRCRGGSGDDPATQAVCAERDAVLRLVEGKGWCWGPSDAPGDQKTWVQCPPAPAPSQAFLDGQRDRQQWEAWFGGVLNEVHAGADYWASHRNTPKAGGCNRDTNPEANASWIEGCQEAQRRLALIDTRRQAEPDYRKGFNSLKQRNVQATTEPMQSAPRNPPPSTDPDTKMVESLIKETNEIGKRVSTKNLANCFEEKNQQRRIFIF